MKHLSAMAMAWVIPVAMLWWWAGIGIAAPWDGYGRTFPVPRYEFDPSADPAYQFSSHKTFPPYTDPPIEEAIGLPSPLAAPSFDSFDVIVVVNRKESRFWGAAETLRAYKRNYGLVYYWRVSTGAKGWETPAGYFLVHGFSSRHWSALFDAPMFWSVFFHQGKALHSSLDRDGLANLGIPASHGCVHIEEYRAEALFHLIGQAGYGMVDRLDRRTGQPLLGPDGNKLQLEAPRALIVVSPVPRFSATITLD